MPLPPKQPLVLRCIETGEEVTYDSTTSAAAFLGIHPGNVARAKMKGTAITSKNAPFHYHAIGKKGQNYSAVVAISKDHRGGLIAFKNLNSKDPDHPEVIMNCVDFEDASRRTGLTEGQIRNRCKKPNMIPDQWYFDSADSSENRRVLRRALEDDGIINLDEADEAW